MEKRSLGLTLPIKRNFMNGNKSLSANLSSLNPCGAKLCHELKKKKKRLKLLVLNPLQP